MITIEDLKAIKTFVLEENEIVDGVPSKTNVLSLPVAIFTIFWTTFLLFNKISFNISFFSYLISCISKFAGDVFGTKRYKVINSLETLFNIAKKRELKINIEKKFDLRISNYNLKV